VCAVPGWQAWNLHPDQGELHDVVKEDDMNELKIEELESRIAPGVLGGGHPAQSANPENTANPEGSANPERSANPEGPAGKRGH
jgi:hypothetical protein